jgi:hypothetical protein
MAKMHSSEAFGDPLEAAMFSVLVGLMLIKRGKI